jgi:hypothetical protein
VRNWSRGRIVAVAVVAVGGLGIAAALAGPDRGVAFYAYILAVVALAAGAIGSRIGKAWPATPSFERLLPPRIEPEPRVLQLEGLVNRLAAPIEYDVHTRLRPLVHEIVSARLAAQYGLDIDRRPERAQALVGPRTWELIRPDREPPRDRFLQLWPPRELAALVDELEAL